MKHEIRRISKDQLPGMVSPMFPSLSKKNEFAAVSLMTLHIHMTHFPREQLPLPAGNHLVFLSSLDMQGNQVVTFTALIREASLTLNLCLDQVKANGNIYKFSQYLGQHFFDSIDLRFACRNIAN